MSIPGDLCGDVLCGAFYVKFHEEMFFVTLEQKEGTLNVFLRSSVYFKNFQTISAGFAAMCSKKHKPLPMHLVVGIF